MMATVEYEGRTLFIGTVKNCEDWIAGQEHHDPVGVQRGDYSIDMTEEEEAAMQRGEPLPDPRIAAYIAEVSQPGIPYISSSHLTLFRLGVEHGQKLVQDLIDQYFAAKREYEKAVG